MSESRSPRAVSPPTGASPTGAPHGLPVVVIGAGPVGLAAAARLVERGLPVRVLERGPLPGAAVREWGHVRLFSTWRDLVDPAARRLLAAHGWREPDPGHCPTGAEWTEEYLAPLAAALGDAVRYDAEVMGVSRQGRDRVVDAGRDDRLFTVRVHGSTGTEELLLARAVIDASGTWGRPNPLGADGLPALGERQAAARISYRVPDLTDPAVRARYAGRRVAVVGSGHSALTALVGLASLAAEHPQTRVLWVLRRGTVGDAFGGGAADQLPARGTLGQRARTAVENGTVEVTAGTRVDTVAERPDGLVLVADGSDSRRREVGPVDEIVTLTGFRPDLTWLSEIRLRLDATLQAPERLAPLIDPNAHSCGTVYPHGAAELRHPETGFYAVGMKSYGRAPTFLALTGFEQARSVVAAIAGDHEAASRVELTLPETGVCSGPGLDVEPGAVAGAIAPTATSDTDAVAAEAEAEGCCGPALQPVGAPASRDAGAR